MATYVNDLRLKEIATGDESGTWGTSTNTNLELIGEALGFGTEAITTNADTHTTTVADGAADPGRAMYLKYTGTLDSACTITIAPNTISRMHFIENGTSGSQNIIISQGSGANITIPAGDVKAVYLDGAGSGAAVVDAFASLNVVDLKVQDDLTLTSDSAVITFGVDGDTTLTHTDGSGLTLNSTNKIMFNDASQFIQGSSATVLALGATDEIDLTATAIDVNGTMDVSGDITSSAGATITVADNSDNLTLTTTDADASAGPNLRMYRNSGSPADSDAIGLIDFEGRNDNSQDVVYAAIDTRIVDASDGTEDGRLEIATILAGTAGVSRILMDATETVFNDNSKDLDFRVESDNDANAFFVWGEYGHTGLGTTTPDKKLVVSDGGAQGIELSPQESGVSRIFSYNRSSNAYTPLTIQSEYLTFGTGTSNAEKARITADGTLLISDTTAITGTTFDARDVDNVTSLAIGNNAGYVTRGQDTTAGANFILQANRGTLTSPTNSNNGDNCGRLFFRGYHTNGFYSSSIIRGFINGANGTNDMPGTLQFSTSADGSATPTERMRINPDGQVSFGTSSPVAGSRIFTLASASTPYGIQTQNDATTGTMYVARFLNNGAGEIGSIKTSNSVTAFNTSSDYRLKENVRPLEDGLSRVSQINPVKFDWISDGTSTEGFIAHELQEVFPDAVNGEKDGEHMQGVDYGKITPLLVKAIQEQQEQIEQLKTEIEKLH